jgi:hypothetical protein
MVVARLHRDGITIQREQNAGSQKDKISVYHLFSGSLFKPRGKPECAETIAKNHRLVTQSYEPRHLLKFKKAPRGALF